MDALLLARLQFALTVGFHFLFPPITIGLSWLLVIVETIGWKRKDELYTRIGIYFGKILGTYYGLTRRNNGEQFKQAVWQLSMPMPEATKRRVKDKV